MVADFSLKEKFNSNFFSFEGISLSFFLLLHGPAVPNSAYAASALFLPLPTPRGSLPSSLQAILGLHFSVTSLKLTSVGKCSHLGQKSWI